MEAHLVAVIGVLEGGEGMRRKVRMRLYMLCHITFSEMCQGQVSLLCGKAVQIDEGTSQITH